MKTLLDGMTTAGGGLNSSFLWDQAVGLGVKFHCHLILPLLILTPFSVSPGEHFLHKPLYTNLHLRAQLFE
jgi:hypothetical protein